jgi:copper chaperone CopZ
VRSAVSNLKGVQSAEVEDLGETQITFDTSITSLDEIENVINDLGYEIRD